MQATFVEMKGKKMISIAICDDEITLLKSKFRLLLKHSLSQIGIQASVTYYTDGFKLLSDFENRKIYDIVILDIDMPSINGKELARKLRAVDSEFTLAFYTAYAEEVFSTIPLGISAFIPKGFDDNEIITSLVQLFKSLVSKKPQYDIIDILKNGEHSSLKIPINNIYYFKFSDRTITMHTYNEIYVLFERTFDKIIKKYLSEGFYKINRTCIVNVAKVHELLADILIMDNGDKLVVSRRSRKGLLNSMTLLAVIREKQ